MSVPPLSLKLTIISIYSFLRPGVNCNVQKIHLKTETGKTPNPVEILKNSAPRRGPSTCALCSTFGRKKFKFSFLIKAKNKAEMCFKLFNDNCIHESLSQPDDIFLYECSQKKKLFLL
jgi:hypothetical protein